MLAKSEIQKNRPELLKATGKMAGLLFAQQFEKDGPPYGGTKEEYLPLFSSFFNVDSMEISTDSIPKRRGNELFFIASAL